jgi:hypothetical protein
LPERAVYSHLLRHTRLEGRPRLHFSLAWLARGTRLSCTPVRSAVRRLAEKGALRIVERSKAGHVVHVHLPDEIRAVRVRAAAPHGLDPEAADFLESRELRAAIHRREHGRCFYCLRHLTGRVQCLDHVVPRVAFGRNGYRNIVSCCLECNSQKGQRPAENFLRQLYRLRRLNAAELAERLRALGHLAAGKLKPAFSPPVPIARRGRPRLNPAA